MASIENVSRKAELFQHAFSPLAEGEARTAGYFSDGKVSTAAMLDKRCVRSSTLAHSKGVGMTGCCKPKNLLNLCYFAFLALLFLPGSAVLVQASAPHPTAKHI